MNFKTKLLERLGYDISLKEKKMLNKYIHKLFNCYKCNAAINYILNDNSKEPSDNCIYICINCAERKG